MHLIAYTSELKPEYSEDVDAVIQDIVAHSKKNNVDPNKSGVLFFHEDRFLQIIEGEEDHLRALMDTIKKDNRHQDIKSLLDSPVKERSFGSWNMGEIQLGKDKNLDAEYLEKITKKYEQLMVADCAVLVHFYKKLLAERKRILGVF